jgi:uncharacterized protein with von Willebrand factor type A (vWA) domain
MVAENNNAERSSENEQAYEKVSIKVKDAADAVRELIRAVDIGAEEKIAIEDQINNISKETESMLDRIDSIAKKNQQKLLFAYKSFLERNLEAVDQRLEEFE